MALCAMTYMHSPHYAARAAVVRAQLATIPNPQIQEQMEIPLAVTHLLPAGMRGALCVILLLGIFGGDSTHLHSWRQHFYPGCDFAVAEEAVDAGAAYSAAALLGGGRGYFRICLWQSFPADGIYPDVVERDAECVRGWRGGGDCRRALLEAGDDGRGRGGAADWIGAVGRRHRGEAVFTGSI